MKKRALVGLGFLLSGMIAQAGCWVDLYWPLNPGDRWFFTRNVTIGVDDWGDEQYQVWQDTDEYDADDFHDVYEIHEKVLGNVYLVFARAGWVRIGVDPGVLLFDDALLKDGGSRTTETTVSQSGVDYPARFTVRVSQAGTVRVPAGTFLNCRSITVSETAYPPGQPAVAATVLTAVIAPGVGLIRKRVVIEHDYTDDELAWVELASGSVGGISVSQLASRSGNLPPSIGTQPRNVTATNDGAAVLTVSAPGEGITYQWFKNGSPLTDDSRRSGTRTSQLRIRPLQLSDAGSYAVRVGNDICFVNSQSAFLSVVRDPKAPSIQVVNPARDGEVSSPLLSISGTANDNIGVASVFVRVNANSAILANGTTNWSAQVSLAVGSNLIQVQSFDLEGNPSPVAVRRLFHALSAPLNLAVSPGGKVIGPTSGQFLVIGRDYMLTAMASNTFIFTGWSGDIVSTNPVLKFGMRSNLTLRANFIPNPFIPVAGTYSGLFLETNEAQHASSGFFNAAVRPSSDFSAYLQNGIRRFSFTGRFNLEGRSTNHVLRPGTNHLTVELYLDLHGNNEITGAVSDGAWASQLIADRAVFSRSNPAANFPGTYTLITPGNVNDVSVPGGDGVGSVLAKPDGKVTFMGTLADDTRVSSNVPLSNDGQWPLYVSLYGGKGSLIGWLNLLPSAEVDVLGRVNWFRPPAPKPKLYTNGFILESKITGSTFSAATNCGFNVTSAEMGFTGGNLGTPLTNLVSFGLSCRITNHGPHGLRLSLKKAGFFDGSATPAGSRTKLPFKGAFLQRQGYGSGFFLGTNQSGRVYVSSAGE